MRRRMSDCDAYKHLIMTSKLCQWLQNASQGSCKVQKLASCPPPGLSWGEYNAEFSGAAVSLREPS